MAEQRDSSDSVIYMITTDDNPFSPFTEWDEWYAFDLRMGYNTLAFLGRLVKDSDQLSDADQTLATQSAIREIARENVLGIYKLVSE
jgi:hypothetical protein